MRCILRRDNRSVTHLQHWGLAKKVQRGRKKCFPLPVLQPSVNCGQRSSCELMLFLGTYLPQLLPQIVTELSLLCRRGASVLTQTSKLWVTAQQRLQVLPS